MIPTLLMASSIVEHISAYDYPDKSVVYVESQGKPGFTHIKRLGARRISFELVQGAVSKRVTHKMRSTWISRITYGKGPNIQFIVSLKQPGVYVASRLRALGGGRYRYALRVKKSSVEGKAVHHQGAVIKKPAVIDTVTRVQPVIKVHKDSALHAVGEKAKTHADKMKHVEPATTISTAIDQHISSSHKHVPTPSSKHSYRYINIVIDPGHGGKDPGSRGRSVQEKTLVLQIAKRLAVAINQHAGYRAILTRNSDRYYGLRERLAIARSHQADLFVAIHADAYLHRFARGASVYALSPKGATSEAARWLAEKENHSELLWGANLSHNNFEVRSVLIDLQQAATVHASLDIGRRVLQHLGKNVVLHHPGVEQAAFVVLKSPDIPSILIETGFVSNRQEERQLKDPKYQQRLADAIVAGITQHFHERPPKSSYIEEWVHHGVGIIVKSGDTLTALASKYHTTPAMLMKINGIKDGQIRIGQSLHIATQH